MTARPARGFRRLAAFTALVTYLLIVAGGVVRVSGSGLGCGATNDWPLCDGGLLPPLRQEAIIEFTHRWLAAAATALVLSITIVAWMRYRHLSRIVWPVTVAFGLFLVQIVLGAVTVKAGLPGTVILIHLANAMLLLGVLVHVSLVASTTGTDRGERLAEFRRRRGSPPRHVQAATLAAAATYVLVLSGAVVVARGAGPACGGWPLCGGGFQIDSGEAATLNLLHRLVAAAVVVAVGAAVMMIKRAVPGDTRLRLVGMLATALLIAQVIVGALVVELRLPAAARGIHLALASALWAVVLLSALMSRTTATTPAAGGRIGARTASAASS